MLLLKNYLLWCNSSITFSKRVGFWAEQNGRTKLIKLDYENRQIYKQV